MFQRILVPLDGSKFSSRALNSARKLAEEFNATLILLNVIDPVKMPIIAGGSFLSVETGEEIELSVENAILEDKRNMESAKRYLRQEARNHKCLAGYCEYYVKAGNPGEQILEAAGENKADLIVMSAHAPAGIHRFIHGGVADDVVMKSNIPVLVIHPELN